MGGAHATARDAHRSTYQRRNRRALRYLHSVAQAFATVDERWLRAIDGIGEWSAQLILLRGLGRMQRAPVNPSLLEAASACYGSLDTQRLRSLAERYGEQAGYWVFYLRAVPALS